MKTLAPLRARVPAANPVRLTVIAQRAFGRAFLVGLLLLMTPGTAAAATPAQVATGSSRTYTVDVTTETGAPAEARRIANAAINWLGVRMLRELHQAMQAGGTAGALEVCHLRDVSTAENALPGLPAVTGFKLTGLRLMNPANAPDAAEQRVLDFIRSEIERGRAPRETIVQQHTLSDGRTEWRGYRVLALQPGCVACHGPPSRQDPALRDRLLERYPGHTAVGFEPGEWRGIIRVSLMLPSDT